MAGDKVPHDTEQGYHLEFATDESLLSRSVCPTAKGFYMTPMQRRLRVAGTVVEQTRQAFAAVDTLLFKAGSSRKHILKAVIWLADMTDFSEMNAVWDAWIPSGHAPVRACGEAKLAEPDLLVEIIVEAAVATGSHY